MLPPNVRPDEEFGRRRLAPAPHDIADRERDLPGLVLGHDESGGHVELVFSHVSDEERVRARPDAWHGCVRGADGLGGLATIDVQCRATILGVVQRDEVVFVQFARKLLNIFE